MCGPLSDAAQGELHAGPSVSARVAHLVIFVDLGAELK